MTVNLWKVLVDDPEKFLELIDGKNEKMNEIKDDTIEQRIKYYKMLKKTNTTKDKTLRHPYFGHYPHGRTEALFFRKAVD